MASLHRKKIIYLSATGMWLLSLLWAAACFAAQSNGRTIVFDLDGVVLYHVPPDSQGQRLISVLSDPSAGGDVAATADTYRVADGFGELVEWLVERGYRISVFSFGNARRNQSAAAAIRLPEGKSLLSAIEGTGGKIFSNTDGFNLDPGDPRKVIDTRLPRFLRPRIVKDLSRIMTAQDAREAYLVEDILTNSAPGRIAEGRRLPGQRETHTIHLPYRYVLDGAGNEVHFLEYPDGFEGAVRRGDLQSTRLALELFAELRNKMAYLAGLILDIESRIAAQPGLSFSEALQTIQWQRDTNGNYVTDRHGDRIVRAGLQSDSSLVRQGAEALEKHPNSTYKFVLPFNPATLCGPLARAFDSSLRLGR